MNEFVAALVLALTLGGVYALTSVGFTMVFGVARVVNFAHGGFYMLGAMLTWLLTSSAHVPYLLSLTIAAVVVGVAAVPMLRLTIGKAQRISEEVGLLGTFGLALIIEQGAFVIFGGQARSIDVPFDQVVELGPIRTTGQRLVVLVVSIVVISALAYAVRRTAWGRNQRAVMGDPDLARVSGVDPRWVRMSTFLLSGVLAAAAGGLVGPIFAVTTSIGTAALLKAFIITVIAGPGNILMAVAASMAIGFAEVYGSVFLSSEFRDGYAYIIVLILLTTRALRTGQVRHA